jgi:hypothetical protein
MDPLYYIAQALKSRIVEEVGFALKVLSNFLVIFVQFAQRNPPQMANVLAPACTSFALIVERPPFENY